LTKINLMLTDSTLLFCTQHIPETTLFIVGNLVRERIVIMYGLLNDADSHSDYSCIVVNDRMICEK